jgi:hypothetical protein
VKWQLVSGGPTNSWAFVTGFMLNVYLGAKSKLSVAGWMFVVLKLTYLTFEASKKACYVSYTALTLTHQVNSP